MGLLQYIATAEREEGEGGGTQIEALGRTSSLLTRVCSLGLVPLLARMLGSEPEGDGSGGQPEGDEASGGGGGEADEALASTYAGASETSLHRQGTRCSPHTFGHTCVGSTDVRQAAMLLLLELARTCRVAGPSCHASKTLWEAVLKVRNDTPMMSTKP